MATITKKELIDRIAESAGHRRVQVKKVIQQFLDEIVNELGQGNRLEFRDFGVFETKIRKELGIIVLAIRKADGRMIFNPPAEAEIAGGDHLRGCMAYLCGRMDIRACRCRDCRFVRRR